MNLKKLIYFLLIPGLLIASCKKNKTPGPKTPDVYVAGYVALANGNAAATYWKNNVITQLTSSSIGASATAIAVEGNDVYVAGHYIAANGISVACYWKNGKIVKLTDSLAGSNAFCIAVQGADVYVGGDKMEIAPFIEHAACWKNGIPVILSDNSLSSSVDGIAIQGNDVYLAGYTRVSSGPGLATYWKNGTPVTLPPVNTTASSLSAIAVNGNDVYLAGEVSHNVFPPGSPQVYGAAYWKNGAITNLHDTTEVSSALGIALQEDNVLIAGYIAHTGKTSIACYWKNSVIKELTDGTTEADAYNVKLQGNDVYVVGNYGGKATYWKNGQLVPLAQVGDGMSMAFDIVITN